MTQQAFKRTDLKFSQEDVSYLAKLYGLKIEDEDLAEVTVRLTSLVDELKKLDSLNLSGIDPMPLALTREGE